MFEKVELPSGGLSLEDRARSSLMSLLVGERPDMTPALQKLVVSLACSDSPPRSPKAGQPYAQLTLGASLVDRVAAVLQLKTLDEVDLLDLLDALRAESEEPPPLTVLRPFFAHKSCTDRVKLRMTLKFVKRSTAKSNPAAWRFFFEHSGPHTRAASVVAVMTSSAPAAFGVQERLSYELAELDDEGFDIFRSLLSDRTAEASSNALMSFADFADLILTAKNLSG